MSLAVLHSRALNGLAAPEVMVEVHLANGLPSFTVVGLADTEVKEARVSAKIAYAQPPSQNQRLTCDSPRRTTPIEVAGVVQRNLRRPFSRML